MESSKCPGGLSAAGLSAGGLLGEVVTSSKAGRQELQERGKGHLEAGR